MIIQKLTKEQYKKIYEIQMKEDFIPEEIKPLEMMEKLQMQGKYEFFGFFLEELFQKEPVSYAFVVKDQKNKVCLLDYFAVRKEHRGKKIGQMAFQMLNKYLKKEGYETLILEVEDPTAEANCREKICKTRRISFYKRCGMHLTGFAVSLFDVELLLMSSNTERLLDTGRQADQIYDFMFPDELTRKKVQTKCCLKAFFLDLDRTTLRSNGRLGTATKQALKQASERGVEIVVASGRAFDTLPSEVWSLPFISYAITSNGAAIYQKEKGCVWQKNIEAKAAKRILDLCRNEEEVTVEVFWRGGAYCTEKYYENPGRYGSASATEYVKRTRRPLQDVFSFAQEHINELESIDFISNSFAKREKLKEELIKLGEEISITSSIEHLIEIAHKENTKGKAAEKVCDLEEISLLQCAAFGDGKNDISMLKEAGVGIAVSNGHEELKRIADYVTASNEEDGVARALCQFFDFSVEKESILL